MELSTRYRTVETLTMVELVGEVDLATLPKLHQALAHLVDEHPGEVVAVDLDGVTAFDDAGFGVIVGAATRARTRGGNLVVVCAGLRLRERLSLSRLDRALDIVGTATQAGRTAT